MPPRLTTAEFIQKAINIHGCLYDYSEVDYQTTSKKIQIVCHIHGVFTQRPNRHLQGDGCPQCANNIKLSYDDFVSKSNQLHNGKYDYSKVIYNGHHSIVTIICPLHGEFEQKANSHLRGCGCFKCVSNYPKTTSTFIQQSRQIHQHIYDYSKVSYINQSTPVCIICPIHGDFYQRPSDHIHSAAGCPKCVSNISKLETMWLDGLNVTQRQVKIDYGSGYYIVDGYCTETNTIYEFYGDYWHGNPAKYSPLTPHPVNPRVTYGELYDKTIRRNTHLQELGYTVIFIWESDYKTTVDNRSSL